MTATASRRELDARATDGLDIRLLWDPPADRALVTVFDAKTDLELEVDVRAGESPLEVFRHPFAYAAHHGVEPHGARRARAGAPVR